MIAGRKCASRWWDSFWRHRRQKGELRSELEKLAAREWRHPATGEPVRFAISTIQRWYYRCVRERHDPVGVLRRKVRTDAGRQIAMSDALKKALLEQYAAHKSWSVKLHHDNLVALAETMPSLRPVPSYLTVRRFLKSLGLEKPSKAGWSSVLFSLTIAGFYGALVLAAAVVAVAVAC